MCFAFDRYLEGIARRTYLARSLIVQDLAFRGRREYDLCWTDGFSVMEEILTVFMKF